jgi:hypothetical protein
MTQEEYLALESAFIEGFRQAGDKQGFLRLARIPLELDRAGQPGLKLMQVVLEDVVDVGRASPGFASRELVYHPLPAKLVTARARLRFRYVSADRLSELSLAELLDQPPASSGSVEHRHDHPHHHHPGSDGHFHGHAHGNG